MNPVEFPEANAHYGPPPGMDENQVRTITAYHADVASGSCDGAGLVVTAWKPTPEEAAVIAEGGPIYLSFLAGGLPPHFVTTDFYSATHPA